MLNKEQQEQQQHRASNVKQRTIRTSTMSSKMIEQGTSKQLLTTNQNN
jgi:hypothetical protein